MAPAKPQWSSSPPSPVSSAYESTAYQPVNNGAAPPHIHPGFTKSKNSYHRRPRFRLLRWWIGEIIAAVVSVVSFTSIIIVVSHYRGCGLEDTNLPSGLTLNGLVAFLSTICRVALMTPVASVISQEVWLWLYSPHRGPVNRRQLRHLALSDEASRSAWGSFLFLLQARRNWLAYLASLLTIVTLTFGTFTQQLIFIKPFPATDPALMPGSVSRSHRWEAYIGLPGYGALQPPLSLKAATYIGALTNSATPLTSDCPSGNCTWPVTPSIAVCGGCVNSTWILRCGSSNNSETSSSPTCQFILPSGEKANVTNLSLNGGIGFHVFPSTGSYYEKNRSDILYIANFEAVGAPNNSIQGTWTPGGTASTVASECALWMCVQSYATRQVSAVQTQTVLNEYYTVDNSSTTNNSLADITFINTPDDLNSSIVAGAKYSVYNPASVAMNQYFHDLFNGTVVLDYVEQFPSSDIIAGLWNSSADLDTWIKSIATSISNVVRAADIQPAGESEFYRGTGSQLGYDVRWPWIILPAISVALSLFFLVVIIARTARSPVRAWKGSALAILFTEIDPELRRQAGASMNDFDGIGRAAGQATVMLENRGYGNWGIRAA